MHPAYFFNNQTSLKGQTFLTQSISLSSVKQSSINQTQFTQGHSSINHIYSQSHMKHLTRTLAWTRLIRLVSLQPSRSSRSRLLLMFYFPILEAILVHVNMLSYGKTAVPD